MRPVGRVVVVNSSGDAAADNHKNDSVSAAAASHEATAAAAAAATTAATPLPSSGPIIMIPQGAPRIEVHAPERGLQKSLIDIVARYVAKDAYKLEVCTVPTACIQF